MKNLQALFEHDAPAAVKDAGLIACAQRVEHYEISGYGTARQYAEALGHAEIAGMLEKILDEESRTNEHLNDLAVNDINQKAI